MKQFILTLTVLAALAVAPARAFDYLAFATSDGEVTTLSVESLTITIADGSLIAADAGGSRTFVLTDLTKMYFTDTPSSPAAIESVAADEVVGAVTVYDMDGKLRGSYCSLASAREALPKGAYVIKTDNAYLKIALQ